jgi:exopolysaccharide biosynthesis polyprenyl glycosylphosphotransferase
VTWTRTPSPQLSAAPAATRAVSERAADGPELPKVHRLQAGVHGDRRFYPLHRLLAPAADITMLAVAAVAAQLLSPTDSPTGHVPPEPLIWSVFFSIAVLALFTLRGMYVPAMRLELLEELRLVVSATAVAATVVMTARVLTTNEPYVAAETVRHWFLAMLLLAAGRGALLLRERRARRNGAARWPTLIIGAGRVGQLTAKRLLDEPELGFKPVAFLDDDPLELGEGATGLPVFRQDWELERIVAEHGIRQAIITFSTASHDALLAVARRCWELGVTVSVVPRLFEIEGERVTTERLGGLPLIAVRPSNPKGWQFAVKYAFDRVVAALGLILLLPLLAGLAIAVWVSLGRPIFYRQRRAGLDGHEFDMLKFRTMRPAGEGEGEADADWALQQLEGKAAGSRLATVDRYTRLGRLLRRASLDELPQLWNVLRGDMSLVGPRPERVNYAQRFEGGVYRYGDRHRVKSGLTGWAQVNGLRGKTSLADRVEWDNYYIENWSLWLDFKIMMRTVNSLARGEGDAGKPAPEVSRP